MKEEIKKKYLAINSFIEGMEKYSEPSNLDEKEEMRALLEELKPAIMDIKLFEKMLREEIKEEKKIYLRTKMEEEIKAIKEKIADRFEKLDKSFQEAADKKKENDEKFTPPRNWNLKKDSLEKGLDILDKSFNELLKEYDKQSGSYKDASLEERYRFFLTFEKVVLHETDSIAEQLKILNYLSVKEASFSEADSSRFNDELVQNSKLKESVSKILMDLMSLVKANSEEIVALEENLKKVNDKDESTIGRKLVISSGLNALEEKLSDLSDRIPETFYVPPVEFTYFSLGKHRAKTQDDFLKLKEGFLKEIKEVEEMKYRLRLQFEFIGVNLSEPEKQKQSDNTADEVNKLYYQIQDDVVLQLNKINTRYQSIYDVIDKIDSDPGAPLDWNEKRDAIMEQLGKVSRLFSTDPWSSAYKTIISKLESYKKGLDDTIDIKSLIAGHEQNLKLFKPDLAEMKKLIGEIEREEYIAHEGVYEVKPYKADLADQIKEDLIDNGNIGSGGSGLIKSFAGPKGEAFVFKINQSTLEQGGKYPLIADAMLDQEVKMYEEVGEHPNIAKCYGTIYVNGRKGMLMESLEGGNLFDKSNQLNELSKSGKITEDERIGFIQHMMTGMLSGLAHMHKAGYAHLDLKGPNVMMDSEGNVKIIDLGLTAGPGGMRSGRLGEIPDNPHFTDPHFKRDRSGEFYNDVMSAGLAMHHFGEGDLFTFGSDSMFTYKIEEAGLDFVSNDANQMLKQLSSSESKKIADEFNEEFKKVKNTAQSLLKKSTTEKQELETRLEALLDKSKADSDKGDLSDSELAKLAKEVEAVKQQIEKIDVEIKEINKFARESIESAWEDGKKKYPEFFKSYQYLDFINRLSHPDPDKRLSAVDALHHPFLSQGISTEDSVKKVFDLLNPKSDDKKDNKSGAPIKNQLTDKPDVEIDFDKMHALLEKLEAIDYEQMKADLSSYQDEINNYINEKITDIKKQTKLKKLLSEIGFESFLSFNYKRTLALQNVRKYIKDMKQLTDSEASKLLTARDRNKNKDIFDHLTQIYFIMKSHGRVLNNWIEQVDFANEWEFDMDRKLSDKLIQKLKKS